jgi:hypothetical protein
MITDAILKFVPFSPENFVMYTLSFEKNTSKKNQLLLQEGQVCNKLYFFVEQGIGRSYLKREAKEVTQWFAGDGNFMSSVDENFFPEEAKLLLCRNFRRFNII